MPGQLSIRNPAPATVQSLPRRSQQIVTVLSDQMPWLNGNISSHFSFVSVLGTAARGQSGVKDSLRKLNG